MCSERLPLSRTVRSIFSLGCSGSPATRWQFLAQKRPCVAFAAAGRLVPAPRARGRDTAEMCERPGRRAVSDVTDQLRHCKRAILARIRRALAWPTIAE